MYELCDPPWWICQRTSRSSRAPTCTPVVIVPHIFPCLAAPCAGGRRQVPLRRDPCCCGRHARHAVGDGVEEARTHVDGDHVPRPLTKERSRARPTARGCCPDLVPHDTLHDQRDGSHRLAPHHSGRYVVEYLRWLPYPCLRCPFPCQSPSA